MSDTVQPTIRLARASDAAELARVAESTFRDTFAAQNKAEDMDLHCRTSYGAEIQAREIEASDRCTLLAVVGAQIVGFAQLHFGEAPACVRDDRPGEVQRLYVVREWHGRGVAPALMSAALAELERRGTEVVWLGVWEHNPRAIAFYRKFGFAEVGEHVFPLGRDPQRDLVLARPTRHAS